MRRLFLVLSTLFLSAAVQAQPWTKNLGNTPVKLRDIVEEMHEEKEAEERAQKKTANEEPEEDEHYHFDRWKWYWEHHTDTKGYLVSPSAKLQAWYKAKQYAAQSKSTAFSSSWTFQGPDKSNGGYSGVGRVNVVAFHPTDSNTFLVGSAGGGTWKTTDGGLTWASLGDKFPVMGVSDIVYNPINPNTIYLATGDREANDTYTVGLLKSTDGGINWDTTGLTWVIRDFKQITNIIINPIDTNSLIASTTAGIFKSNDAGKTFIKTLNGSFKQVIYNPADTNILYATGTTTGTNQIFRSVDGGFTWTQQSNFGANSRVAAAVTKADATIVKAVVAEAGNYSLEGIYSSSDTGKTYTLIYRDTAGTCVGNILSGRPEANSCDGQSWYDLTIAISPVNAQNVVVGAVNTWYSNNGGSTWDIANQWTGSLPGIKVVHADKHFHTYNPLTPNTLYECNDGGIYKTSNPLSSLWTDLTNGLGITQFYRNSVSDISPFVLGGAQDNGSKKLQGSIYSDLTGGDGMNCEHDPVDNKIFYTAIQYGDLRKTENGGASFSGISNKIPGNVSGTGEWITPYILQPNNSNNILAGYNKIFFSTDRGESWTAISGALGSNAKRIAMSPDKNNNIYVVLASSGLRYTTDFGANWKTITNKPNGTISDIAADPKNGDKIYLTYSGYDTVKVATYTLNGKWQTMNENLPNIPVYCMTIDNADGTLYIGTDFGVYYRATTMTQWEPYNNGLPNIEVTDLGINYTTNEIWASTYGRGMWKSPRYGFPVGITTVSPYATDVIKVFPNPNKGSFTLQTTNKALLSSTVDVQIVDMQGRTAWKQNVKVPADGNITIDATLATGSYMVQILKDNIVFSKAKMVTYQ